MEKLKTWFFPIIAGADEKRLTYIASPEAVQKYETLKEWLKKLENTPENNSLSVSLAPGVEEDERGHFVSVERF